MPSASRALIKVRQLAERPILTFLALAFISISCNVAAHLALGPAEQLSQLDFDEQEYYQLAASLREGTYEYQSRRALGHAVVLAGIQLLANDSLPAEQAILTVIFSLTSPLAYLLVRRMSGRGIAGVLAALATCVWPMFVFYGSSFYSETTALPVFLLFLLALPRGARLNSHASSTYGQWIVAGLLLGVCIHIRTMYLLFSPLAVVIVLIEENGFWNAVRHSVVLAAGCLFVVLPWSWHVSSHEGTFVLISSNGGETLSGGLNQVLLDRGYEPALAPDGRYTWIGPGKWIPEHESGYLTESELKLPRGQRNGLLAQRTWEWVAEHPGRAVYLETAKLLYLWGVYPIWNGAQQTLLGNVPTLLLMALSAVALWTERRRWRQLSRYWMLPVFVTLVALISWGSWRFRQPGDLGLIMLCADALALRLVARIPDPALAAD